MIEVWAALLVALLLAVLAFWVLRKGVLLWVAGVNPTHVQTVPDRARYTSMGAIVVLTASSATASLTVALTLVFGGYDWLRFLPVGMLWGAVVFTFDRWIVSSVDYGPLTAAEKTRTAYRSRSISKIVQFLVRLTMAGLVGLIISEPIVLAVFGPEINQQLIAQHAADVSQQTTQIDTAQQQQLVVLNRPVLAADTALAAATAAADNAHKIYICELTGKCDLPPGEVTGVPGAGPQAAQDFTAWQNSLRQQQQDLQIANQASAAERTAAVALARQTSAQIKAATATVDSDDGLLAREKALDTLSRQNPGFLLRRVVLWLALMFIDLAPVLLKTFSPRTLYEVRVRSEAIRIGRNATSDAEAESDHESAKKVITREFDLEYHRAITELEYSLRLEAARAERRPGEGSKEPSGDPQWVRPQEASRQGVNSTVRENGGWVIGRRWQFRRPLSDVPNRGRPPFVAVDLTGAYTAEVVVKIIAPPPRVAGSQALRERRHAQMEMSLPQGHIHDNIAEVLDADLDPEHGFYIVTRLYPGTLEQFLRAADQRHSLTMGQVLDFSVQILAGLRAAWDRGFVHLDLKPANIALDEHQTVKLIDFGLAQRYQEVNGGNDTTTTAARFTLFYAPPEQMERCDPSWISRNADLRALAAVIYRMLTGYPPIFREARALGLVDPSGNYDAAAYSDMKELVGSVEPVPVATLMPHAPQELDMLLRTWLRIDAQMRCPGNPKTMSERVWVELVAVLEQVQGRGRQGDPAGLWLIREPEFTTLRAQRSRIPSRRPNAPAEDGRSGETLEVVNPSPGVGPSHRDPASTPGADGAPATPWWSGGDEDPTP